MVPPHHPHEGLVSDQEIEQHGPGGKRGPDRGGVRRLEDRAQAEIAVEFTFQAQALPPQCADPFRVAYFLLVQGQQHQLGQGS
ncbi:MAG TPA: hypothetical protein VGC54_13435 [Planctomycetota bacterium]